MGNNEIEDFFNDKPKTPVAPPPVDLGGAPDKKDEQNPIEAIISAFKTERAQWASTVTSLASRLSRAKGITIVEVQSDVVSERQRILERHHELLLDISGILKKKRLKEAERTKFYMTQFDRKMTVSERDRMIEGDMAELLFLFKLYTDHANYLDETKKGIDHMIYGIRNVVSMIEYTNPMPK